MSDSPTPEPLRDLDRLDVEPSGRRSQAGPPAGALSRRDALRLLAVSAAAPVLLSGCGPEEAAEGAAHHAAARARGAVAPAVGAEPGFFTAHEFDTVRLLADYVLPADDRGPSAAEVGVPEFIDFLMTDDQLRGDMEERQTAMRGGLGWLDAQCRRAHGQPFTGCSDAQRRAMLDRIAYPDDAAPADAPGVRFFNRFRDYTAAGYFSSPQGMDDLGYVGNTSQARWTGCSDEADAWASRTV